MSTYEILVFENHDLYDSDIADPEDIVKKFVNMCYRYINPWDVEEWYTCLCSTNKSITYYDRCGSDKPKMVMLVGPVTGKLYDDIKAEIKNLYIKKCDDCGVQVPLNQAVCKECANK